jgi:hypothetical protein
LISSFALNGGYIITCSDWDEENSQFDLGDGVWAGSIELTSPMTAGQPYAISDAYVDYATGIIEYYGTTEECGAGLQLLSSQEGAGRFLICHDTIPNANYTHIIQVWRDVVGSQGDMTFCPDATCD